MGIFYNCIPVLNNECKKNNCYLNGGECYTTTNIDATEIAISKLKGTNMILNSHNKGLLKQIDHMNQCIKDDKENADEIISEQAKEIERLNKDNGDITKLFAKEREETKRLHSIIKEVREYINEDKNCVPKHIKEYFKDLLDKVGEE